jgi:ArsR family transcriptional regulator, virulence genes transcriptional regulator
MDKLDLTSGLKPAAQLMRALANERRLMILCLLSGGEINAGALAEAIGVSQSALSQHLAKLREDGLVKTRKQSQTVYYSLASVEAATVIRTLSDLYCRPQYERDSKS